MKDYDSEKMQEKELFNNYRKTNNLEIRNFIVTKYIPLIKTVVKTVITKLPRFVEYEDAVSYGVLGLIDAIEKYNVNKGIQFNTYAVYRIRGAIFDGIRKYDTGYRYCSEKRRKIKKIANALESKLGCVPNSLELANALNMNITDFNRMKLKIEIASHVPLSQVSIGSIEDYSIFENIQLKDYFNPDVIVEKKELKKVINDTVKSLTARKRDLIIMRYYKNMTFTKISKIMGVSQPTVCLLHKRIKQKLKNDLNGVTIND